MGSGSLAWITGLVPRAHRLLVFANGPVLVVVNFDEASVTLPPGTGWCFASHEMAGSSDRLKVPTDAAAWALLSETQLPAYPAPAPARPGNNWTAAAVAARSVMDTAASGHASHQAGDASPGHLA